MLLLLTHILSIWPFSGQDPLLAARASSCCQNPLCPTMWQARVLRNCHHPGSGPWCLTGGVIFNTPAPSPWSGVLWGVLPWLPGVSVDTGPFLWVVAHLIIHLDWLIIRLSLLTSPPASLPPTGVFLGSSPTLAMTLSQPLWVSTLRWDWYVGSPQELVALGIGGLEPHHWMTWWPQITTLDLSFYLERR